MRERVSKRSGEDFLVLGINSSWVACRSPMQAGDYAGAGRGKEKNRNVFWDLRANNTTEKGRDKRKMSLRVQIPQLPANLSLAPASVSTP